MATEPTLLYTDVVDSTALNTWLGDAAMAEVWALHDRGSRDLLARWRGREVDRSDGLLALFESALDAADFAAAYHRLLAALPVPLRARVGLHTGPLSQRENAAAHVQLGAKAVEVTGIGKAVSARLMALARGGQTLASPSTVAALATSRWRRYSHGHWRLKGWDEPIEVFELGAADSALMPPADGDKARRVVLVNGQWISAGQVPHNLPAERDGFVGRAEDLRALASCFESGARLVTLHGPGGVGKTRLALRHGWAWHGDYPGGLWFCDLAQARSLDGLLQAVSHGLDVPLGSDPVGQLGRAIAGRGRCLVIMDNVEQVARHVPDTLGRWLDAAPAACFVVTSREVLGLPGERMLALPPLTQGDAAALFHQRAKAADAGYDASGVSTAVISGLVDLLDRLPLAIELAAARVRTMAPQELLARMGNRFQLLASRAGRPNRQATLLATLQWSWELLEAAERSALAQLSVFDGGAGWAAIESVLDVADCARAPWVADLIQSLMDKSLLRPLAHGRFGLLRSVQEYAAEQLVAGSSFPASGPLLAAQTRRRHRLHFAGLDEQAAVADNCVELDNLVLACRSAVAEGDADTATACLSLAWEALRLTGPFHTAVTLADEAGSIAGIAGARKAQVLWVAGMARYAMGAFGASQQLLALASAALPLVPDARQAAQLQASMGAIETALGDLQQAAARLQSAQALATQAGHAATLCQVLNEQGALAAKQGRIEQARSHYEAALTVAKAAGHARWQGGLLGNLAALQYVQGHVQLAGESYEQALRLARACGDRRWEGNTLCNLGLIHHDLGRSDLARTELDQALYMARSMGHRSLEYTVLCNLGLVLQTLGLLDAALEHHAGAVAGAQALGDASAQAQFRCCWSLALAHAGRFAQARDCVQAAMSAPGDAHDAQSGLTLCCAALVEHLAGDQDAAKAALGRARDVLSSLGPQPGSELERQIAEVARSLDQ